MILLFYLYIWNVMYNEEMNSPVDDIDQIVTSG